VGGGGRRWVNAAGWCQIFHSVDAFRDCNDVVLSRLVSAAGGRPIFAEMHRFGFLFRPFVADRV